MSRPLASRRTLFVIGLCFWIAAGVLTPHGPSRAQPADHGRRAANVVQTLPRGYHTVRSQNREYYVHRGRFYEHRHGGYVVVRPPIGVVIAALPPGYVVVYIGGSRYYYVGGAYFRPAPTGYVIVEPPHPAAPRETHTVMVQAGRLNVRDGPGLHFGVVTIVDRGTRLTVHGTAPDWYYVRLPDGSFGWVMTRFTLPVADEPRG